MGGDRIHRATPGDAHAHAVVHQLAYQGRADAANLINGLVLVHCATVGDTHAGQPVALFQACRQLGSFVTRIVYFDGHEAARVAVRQELGHGGA